MTPVSDTVLILAAGGILLIVRHIRKKRIVTR